MPLNKLDNFIKNTEGRILYVNPSDLDATDSIDNQGNSLARPFKTIQRAIIEAARFSYVRGNNNDFIEKTTILLFPGEYTVDNRPGWAIKNDSGIAKAISPSGTEFLAVDKLSLGLDSIFDLTQEDNILYKFNSVFGGIIIPRGVSIVGLDLRKTKIRPKYVPNPTVSTIPKSSIFRLTGACYIWQVSFFDGNENGIVYTDPESFSDSNTSVPKFSHHKLTCFEYADGVNQVGNYGLTDLDMYYSKLSNAFNAYREIPSADKFPVNPDGFAKRTPEWEIVGAFASDPINISSIFSGDGVTTVSNRITVVTTTEHSLNQGTPIKIKGVSASEYNISTTVQEVLSPTSFTYLIPSINELTLPVNPTQSSSSATVTVETDTVSGASPYIFNCSLRSVWGMNGIHADGSKASGFRSMVTAQFTGVSLQKDDRAFVKYNKESRTYNGVPITPTFGSELALGSSQTNSSQVYHLDPEAIYRNGWESSHIKISNDAFIQVVSVFAIGFNKHFDAESGGDFSITNSNSNFGQFALSSSGFRKTAFDKDDKAFITSIITPRAIESIEEENVFWVPINVGLTTTNTRLYLNGFDDISNVPSSLIQGFYIGAKVSDKLFLKTDSNTEVSASIVMDNGASSKKEYTVTQLVTSNGISTFTLSPSHNLSTGEKVIIRSTTGDLPEGVNSNSTYYAIVSSSTQIRLASSFKDAQIGKGIIVYGSPSNLRISSLVSGKSSGELGSPIQFDEANQNWYISVSSSNNTLYTYIQSLTEPTTGFTYIKRISDDRSIDEKIYKLRASIPKELQNAKNPESGFVIQESNSTSVRKNEDFTLTSITDEEYDYNRNPRFIVSCTVSSNTVTVTTEKPHNLTVGEIVNIKNVKSTTNTNGTNNIGFNGTFVVSTINDDLTFRYSTTDVDGVVHNVGTYTNNINIKTIENLGRFERANDLKNIYIYRNEIKSEYEENIQDGVYNIYPLNSSNAVPTEFTTTSYSQNTVDLYPQLDRDNINDNPLPSVTFAKRNPLGDVETNEKRNSLTRETINKFLVSHGQLLDITSVSASASEFTLTFDRPHGLNGIVDGTITGGSGYTNGTYHNVKLLNGGSSPTANQWKGALATVVVSGGVVTTVTVTNSGSAYDTSALFFDNTRIGAGDGLARFTPNSNQIISNIDDVIQITGSNTQEDTYHRITSIVNATQIRVSRSSGQSTPSNSQFAFIVGPSTLISSTSYNSNTKIATVTCSRAHGLSIGNKVTILNSSNVIVGEYIVRTIPGVTSFTVYSTSSISATSGYVLKHGLSAANSSEDNDNFASRNITFYAKDYVRLTSAINNSSSSIGIAAYSGSSLQNRFKLGDYIQIDNEIMRIVSTGNVSSATVIRGVFGTRTESHLENSLIKKIKPLPIEFRRPSILRASGHTFEYLGYGPGNYSTALPQIQIKTLSDRQSFLANAQEKSGGIVVYNGINNAGDVFYGNTKTTASSGEIVSFDIPNPTVIGQDSSTNTAIFDEVTIKQRLLVEGGNSGTILSQFDGPVTFSKNVKIRGDLNIEGNLNVTLPEGVPIVVNGDNEITGSLSVDGESTFTGEVSVETGIVPDISKGAYIGSASKPFNGAHIGNIEIGVDDDNTIDTSSGDLVLSATDEVQISKNTIITGNLTVNGEINSTGQITSPSISPVGTIVMWPSENIPDDWRICDGDAVSRSVFSDLFAVIGTNYGVGDNSTTFNLPNLTNLFVAGAGSDYNLGQSGGANSVALTVGEMPQHNHTGSTLGENGAHNHQVTGGSHNHGGSTGNNSVDHTHGVGIPYDTRDDNLTETGFVNVHKESPTGESNTATKTYTTSGQSQNHTHSIVAESHTHTVSENGTHSHTLTIAAQGSGTAHENRPPFLAMYYIIKVR